LKKSDNMDDQKFLIDLLGLIRNSDCQDTIIRLLESTVNENVKLACIETLGNLQCTKSVKVLFNLFGTNELLDPTILEALGKINTPEVLEFIIAQYESGDELIKYSILECLGEIGNEETFFFLLSILKETSGP